MDSLICIIAAMKEEASLIKGRMKVSERPLFGHAKGFLGTWQGRDILVVQSGVGKKRARNVLEKVLGDYSPTLVISCGFAGGLNTDLKLGDVLIADTVLDINYKSNNENFEVKTSKALNSTEALKAKEMSNGFPFEIYSGSLITSDTAICIPEKKKELGDQNSALGVDMETSALLEVTSQRSIPLVSIRVISDTVDQELANFSPCIDENGNVSKMKAGWYILTNPSLIPMAISLKSQMPVALKNMTEFLEKFVSIV
jgi:adenosylhomocysteine nucleosidase